MNPSPFVIKTKTSPQFILSLSGGLDSAVLCADLLADHGPEAVLPVFFAYASKHNAWEKKAAQAVARHYGITLKVVDLSPVFAHVSSGLLSSDQRSIPEASYDQASMSLTAVPGRNLIFASVLAALAESLGIPTLALATHGGDHFLYPDCRPAFNAALDNVVGQSSAGQVRVSTPFARISKADIVALGLQRQAPFQLTRSCYQDSALSCGHCGTCAERLEAFRLNQTPDPICYQAT